MISYGKVEDVQWTILTNGNNLKIFDTKAGKNETECMVVVLWFTLKMNTLSLD